MSIYFVINTFLIEQALVCTADLCDVDKSQKKAISPLHFVPGLG